MPPKFKKKVITTVASLAFMANVGATKINNTSYDRVDSLKTKNEQIIKKSTAKADSLNNQQIKKSFVVFNSLNEDSKRDLLEIIDNRIINLLRNPNKITYRTVSEMKQKNISNYYDYILSLSPEELSTYFSKKDIARITKIIEKNYSITTNPNKSNTTQKSERVRFNEFNKNKSKLAIAIFVLGTLATAAIRYAIISRRRRNYSRGRTRTGRTFENNYNSNFSGNTEYNFFTGNGNTQEQRTQSNSTTQNNRRRLKTHYEVLNIKPTATPEEIRAAYKELAKKFHPDKGGSADKMIKLNEIKDTLLNPLKRREYNQSIGV